MTAVLPMMPVYLHEIGVEDAESLRYWTGILGSAPFAVAVFFTPIWGALADRVGHKPMVVRSVFGIAFATFGMGLATAPSHLLGWRALQGAVSGVFPAAVALLTALTPEVRSGRALAMLQSARSGGSLLGPLLGGVITDIVGVRPLFFLFGAISAAAAVACSWLIEEKRGERSESLAQAERSQRARLLSLEMWGMLLLIGLFQIGIMTSWPTLALFVQQFGVPQATLGTTTGLIVLAAGLPATLAATSWTRVGHRLGLGPAITLSLLMMGLANGAVGYCSRLAFVFPLRVIAGLSTAGFIPLAFEWLNRRTPGYARGRVAGYGSTAMMMGNVVGPLLGGWLAVHVGLSSTFWMPGLGIAAIALIVAFTPWSRR